MLCKHQFFKTGEVSRQQDIGGSPRPKFVVGIEVVCVSCGQVRHAFADGFILTKVWGGKPIDEDHVDTGRA